MGIVVQKYGGSSVATPDRIRNVARRVAATAERSHRVVVVVSAMGDTTDRLMEQAQEISRIPHARELDMLLSAGERISLAGACCNTISAPVLYCTLVKYNGQWPVETKCLLGSAIGIL